MKVKSVSCPCCQSNEESIALHYGLVTLDIIKDIKQGKIAIGDGSLWPNRPSQVCKNCNIQYSNSKSYGNWKNSFNKIHKTLAEAA